MNSSVGRIFAGVLISLLFVSSSLLKAQFIDVTANQLMIENVNENTIYGDGVSFYDFDQNGWDDVTLANGSDVPFFFRNFNGQLSQFDAGIENAEDKLVLMTLWADYDNDGDKDLFITRDSAPMQLWQNDGNMNFINVAQSAGLEQGDYEYWGAAFADYNHDGCLDLFVAKYYHPTFNPGYEFRSLLYINNCDGTFTDVSIAAGIDLPPRPTFQPVFLDYNNDGWEDLFLVIDRIQFRNELFRNSGDGTFTNVTVETGINYSICSMTGTIDDFDNDLDEDIYVTNSVNGNLLMVNNGLDYFENYATEMGVVMNQVCWGSLWIDYDNNSWQDLFVSVTSPYLDPIGNQLFRNDGGLGFTNITDISGFDLDTSETHMVSMGDLNNDGYYDMLQNNKPPHISKLWQNMGGAHHYISASLEGTFSNRDGVGAKIHCYAGGEHYYRMTRCGENFTAQNSGKEIFGLGNVDFIDSLVVEWNRGTIDKYYALAVDQHLHIVEGNSGGTQLHLSVNDTLDLCNGETVLLDPGIFTGYEWSTGDTSRFLEVSATGNYRVLITNLEGIEFYSEWLTVIMHSIQTPDLLIDSIGCYNGGDGIIELIPDTTFSGQVIWETGHVGFILENVEEGMYFYSLLDDAGCSYQDSVLMNAPPILEVSYLVEHPLCHGADDGYILCEASGGTPPYAFDWQGLDSLSLQAGNFNASVIDAEGCILPFTFTVEQPDPLLVNVTSTAVSCAGQNDGSVLFDVSGGVEPYEILFDGDIENLIAGDYEYNIQDAHGCLVSGNFIVQEPDSLNCSVTAFPFVEGVNEGSAVLSVLGGTPPYEILWSSGEYDVNGIDDLVQGDYSVSVMDHNGCDCIQNFTIEFVAGTSVNVETISVSPVPADDVLIIRRTSGLSAELSIYDLRGNLVVNEYLSNAIELLKINDLSNGMYCMVINDDKETHQMRIVIQHQD